ncbi:MAG TPA: 23S rRNA (pseudouridine(1915)-N(3))-methyltransferase RlmH [Candidatus Merdicola faecigallinarum]|uniref:Ribosomal RNA large subunit methyltransferase H n=1 Tax=Candidatus Merdicola faecigallinarum TaxID=2840862 RepID=A0A9D1M0G6_9FIRM|nr:23S rRNA (pseudouridine(1915)-N(3))-methyltransferase RlmH [Candidatus Merdicola faecigallinarum]
MLSIHIITVGKLKESFFRDAVAEYSKRLSKYCNLTITEISDEKLPDKINANLIDSIKQKEGQKILSSIKKDSYIICLDLHGKEFTSEEFSKKIDSIALNYNSSITFVIGGTLGLDSQVLSYCQEKVCFSKLTFPHQLIRIFLLEQLFRAFKISHHETYHW